MTPDRRQFAGLMAAAGLAGLPGLAGAQVVMPPPPAPSLIPPPDNVEGKDPSRVPTGQDDSFRLTAPVMVNGQGPFPFLVDTGANRSCVSLDLAQRLNLPAGPQVSLHTVARVAVRPSVIVDRLQLGERSQRNVRVPALNLLGAPGVDGILGIDWLKGRRLMLNFKDKLLEILPPMAEQSRTGQVVVPARRRSGQLTMVDADVGGARISAMIDSGSELSLGNLALRRLVAGSGSVRAADFRRVTITTVVGESFPGDMLYVPFMRLGGLTIGNAPVIFADTHVFKLWDLNDKPAVILGMDLLTQFNAVVLDFGRSTVRFDFT